MNVALWIVAGLLAAAYSVGGGYKLVTPKEKIAAARAAGEWVDDFSSGGVKAIGALEILGSLQAK